MWFQEFKQVMDLLNEVYFTNATTFDAVVRQNIAYLSDVIVRDDVLKSVAHQANVNNRNVDKSKRKNTFLFRWNEILTWNGEQFLNVNNNYNYSISLANFEQILWAFGFKCDGDKE